MCRPPDFFSLQGDANRDGTVGFDDLVILAQNYNQSGRTYAEGDLDGDGSVTFDDLVILRKNDNSSVTPAIAPSRDRLDNAEATGEARRHRVGRTELKRRAGRR